MGAKLLIRALQVVHQATFLSCLPSTYSGKRKRNTECSLRKKRGLVGSKLQDISRKTGLNPNLRPFFFKKKSRKERPQNSKGLFFFKKKDALNACKLQRSRIAAVSHHLPGPCHILCSRVSLLTNTYSPFRFASHSCIDMERPVRLVARFFVFMARLRPHLAARRPVISRLRKRTLNTFIIRSSFGKAVRGLCYPNSETPFPTPAKKKRNQTNTNNSVLGTNRLNCTAVGGFLCSQPVACV